MQKDMLFWIWLSEALGPASRDFRGLISLYDNPYDLFHAEDGELERLEISERTRQNLLDKSLAEATAILDACERLQIGILPYGDPAYPNSLRQIKEPPVLLYYRGKLPDFSTRICIGMVGTRSMSLYGLRLAYKTAYELASANVMVVSGMATGIDGVCAAGALAATGETVAILGCGVDVTYPRHHKNLMNEIVKKGVVFSEYPPGTRPKPYHFPTRNRLISGLSQGTAVMEAGVGSGSLITAKDAILQGREVFAFPANIGSKGAEGTNALLRDGAYLVLNTRDILEPYRCIYAETLHTERLIKAEQNSRADMNYLERLGVIQLTPAGEKESTPSPVESKDGKKKTSKKRPAKSEKESIIEQDEEPSVMKKCEDRTGSTTPDELISSLTAIQLAVLQAIPDDRSVTADSLDNLGYPYGETVAALTMLEIMGLIQKLPGALYIKT